MISTARTTELWGLLIGCLLFQGVVVQGQNISQWVSSIRSYSTQYSVGEGVTQIIGPSDGSSHWTASSPHTSGEYIEYEITNAVYVISVETFETLSCGFIVQIFSLNPSGQWEQLYTGAPTLIAGTRIFSPPLLFKNYMTKTFRLNIDCSQSSTYCFLEAVRTTGYQSLLPVAALLTSASLTLPQFLRSQNNQHNVSLDLAGGITIDGQQWIVGDPSALSATLNYTQKHQLILMVNGNSTKWQLDLPKSSSNGPPGNVTVTNDGLLQIVNANGVPLWNHKQGYLLPRLVSANGPNWRTAALIEDRNNATCTPEVELITLRVAPTLRNATTQVQLFGRNLTCSSKQLNVAIPGMPDPPVVGSQSILQRSCSLLNSTSSSCTYNCVCPTDLCETMALASSGCNNVQICEITFP